jgi:hypothetical protein
MEKGFSNGRWGKGMVDQGIRGSRRCELNVFGVFSRRLVVVVVFYQIGDRDRGLRAREVGDESESGNSEVRLGSIEFGDDIGGTDSLANNHHRS